jgi:hypothetical protein
MRSGFCHSERPRAATRIRPAVLSEACPERSRRESRHPPGETPPPTRRPTTTIPFSAEPLDEVEDLLDYGE